MSYKNPNKLKKKKLVKTVTIQSTTATKKDRETKPQNIKNNPSQLNIFSSKQVVGIEVLGGNK